MAAITRRTTIVGIVLVIMGFVITCLVAVWSVTPLRQVDRMSDEIERAICRTTKQYESDTYETISRRHADYPSSFELRDRKDHYELYAYLPDAKAWDVNVRTDNDRALRVSVIHRKQETKNEGGGAGFAELGQYEQLVTMPGLMKPNEMKVDRHDHEIVITIPKAKTG